MAKTVLENSDASEVFTEVVTPVLAPGEIVLGYLKGIHSDGSPMVVYPNMPSEEPIAAMSTVSVTQQHIGRQIALLFAKGDYQQPVIMGLIYSPLNELLESFSFTQAAVPASEEAAEYSIDSATHNPETVTVDGKRVVLEGKEEIVLKCGEASITLTKAGKILIRGKYLLSRSSGVNRILGGSVQVN